MASRHAPTTYAEVDKDGLVHGVKMGCVEPPRPTRISRWWLPFPSDLGGDLTKIRWRWGLAKWDGGTPVKQHERGILLREETR